MNVLEVKDPDGHTFRVINEEPSDAGAVASLCLHVANLEKAAGEWGPGKPCFGGGMGCGWAGAWVCWQRTGGWVSG